MESLLIQRFFLCTFNLENKEMFMKFTLFILIFVDKLQSKHFNSNFIINLQTLCQYKNKKNS